MGQNSSNLFTDLPNVVPETISNFNIKAHVLQEIINLTREDFTKYLDELNELSRNCLISNGRQMLFGVKKGTDTSELLWKIKIRISCVKFDPATKRIDTLTLLNLRQFMQLFRTLQTHLETMISTNQQSIHMAEIDQNLLENACAWSTTSSFDEMSDSLSEECCICLDRKPDLILPCLHLFCSTCIEQWNASNKTCPICQEKLDSTDESWVISEIPQVGEISEEIRDTLLNISEVRTESS